MADAGVGEALLIAAISTAGTIAASQMAKKPEMPKQPDLPVQPKSPEIDLAMQNKIAQQQAQTAGGTMMAQNQPEMVGGGANPANQPKKTLLGL